MARWKLMAKHYLAIKEIDGEAPVYIHTEQDTRTGRNKRKIYNVPMLLDPEDPSCWTETVFARNGAPVEGTIVVSDGKNAQPRDLIMCDGVPPTTDMMPLDDEAEEISRKINAARSIPFDAAPGQTGEELIRLFTQQMNQLQQAIVAPAAQSLKGVSEDAFQKLQEQVAALMAKNAELEAQTGTDRRG